MNVPVVSSPVEERLDERQLVDYREYKRDLLKWLHHLGKNPDHAEGYAETTVRQVSYKVDKFYRWLWNEEGYTTSATPDDADDYMRHLVYSDTEYSTGHKASSQKCLKRLFKWRRHELGEEVEWEPTHSFSPDASQPRDYLTVEERKLIREAALEYGSVPSYSALDPQERQSWKRYLAQRFEKPIDDVSVSDFDRANGWKIPSLTWVSLDCGLRPVEVERATVNWVDTENNVLRIPKAESSKNTENWIVGVTERTSTALERWLIERQQYDQYQDTDALWLTRHGNPYNSSSLKYILSRLCEIAEIPTENRSLSWYAIRHSVGTYMTREQDLAAAQAQLRHKSPETTMRYDQTPIEDRRDALNRMG
ncbi:tyrosine-type recombinase/integrase [Natrinema salifodinae]|uniref:Site-specific recombinase XerD n=1 Tax=Natrinema salifodinae TaxID=1202768 RepID=A0A1I0NAU0_9EURY|nr:site-specific integrase [Natrinema salifodinae]SEV98206.1 Site-specific recombinase XerD [Natrinema salifodinae]